MVTSTLRTITAWEFLRRLLFISLPLLLVLVVGLWSLYRTEADALRALMRADGRYEVELAARTIDLELQRLGGDVRYLAGHSTLRQWLETGSPATLERLTSDLLTFSRHRGLYDQVRFLDEEGREVVRINSIDGDPVAVPRDNLQDKSDRYYVRGILSAGMGSIYVSPFDLNVEQGRIEQPRKPVIRVGTLVEGPDGKVRGMMVLNYLGDNLLNHLREIHSRFGSAIWLLNAQGYWLLGPSPDEEWGFMRQGDDAPHVSGRYAQAWQAIREGSFEDQFRLDSGLFTYRRVQSMSLSSNADDQPWVVMVHMPESVFASELGDRFRVMMAISVILVLLLLLVSGLLAYNESRRRNFEAQVRENEELFRGLLDSAADAIVIVNAGGTIEIVNAQAEKWFGYSRDELLGVPVERLIPQRFRDHHVIQRQGYIKNPVTRPMGAGFELFARRKDGSEFPVEISLSPLGTGEGLLVTSIIRDITARRWAEEAQRQSRARYRELVNNLPVGIYRSTPGAEGRILEANPAMFEMFEADSPDELLSHPIRDLYCRPEMQQIVSEKILEQGDVTGEEVKLRTLRGREFIAAITATMKMDAEGKPFFDGIVEDITRRKESERRIQQLNENLRSRSMELESINRELESFSYSVSHDLRAPLRAMDGFSRMLLTEYENQFDDKGRDRLQRIRAAAQRMGVLIDDLLKLSRVSRAEIKWEPLELDQVAEAVMEELRQGDPSRKVDFEAQPGLATKGDPTLIRALMDNLIGNAWKFTGMKEDARIEVGRMVGGEADIYFVRDNGAGFDMAYADKLFGAFQRLHDTGEFPGTGIGLATVQRIIRKHGGRIWADGAVGQGATFYFTLQPGGDA